MRIRRSTGSRSSARRTKETASRSTSCSTAKSTQARSSRPADGSGTSAPGRFRPWWEATEPPASTAQRHLGRLLADHAEADPPVGQVDLAVLEDRGRQPVPGDRQPLRRAGHRLGRDRHLGPGLEARPCRLRSRPAAASGPGRSPRMPISLPVISAASRVQATFSACSSRVPCEKLRRNRRRRRPRSARPSSRPSGSPARSWHDLRPAVRGRFAHLSLLVGVARLRPRSLARLSPSDRSPALRHAGRRRLGFELRSGIACWRVGWGMNVRRPAAVAAPLRRVGHAVVGLGRRGVRILLELLDDRQPPGERGDDQPAGHAQQRHEPLAAAELLELEEVPDRA